ncbi:DUF2059 domain-containing protein [Roseomonas sp. BN140053]|uniref:DUF2059 domain-containing protein n=1 Tax=Roseomonas sp. BN140053 TaxID=3391898 RepID=UPI0039E9134E
MLLRRLILLAFLLCPALPADAQPATAESDAPAAARVLIEVTGTAAVMEQMLEGMRTPIVQLLRQQSPQLPAATVERAVDELLMPEFRVRLPEFLDAATAIYVANFTVEELRELAAFYTTPLGAKTIRIMPQMVEQSMAAGQAWGQRVAREVLRKNAASLRERGINL